MNTRLSKFKKLLSTKSLDAALISSVPDIIYLTDFSYFSNMEREAFLLITKNNNYIITDGRYVHAVKKHVKDFKLLVGSETTSHEKILELEKILKQENIKSLGIDAHNLTVYEHEKILSRLNNNKKLIKKINHIDLSSLRIIKVQKEIKKIKKACQIGDKAFTHILSFIKVGMAEKDIAFELEHFIRKQGSDISFATILAFEENAAIPHHKTGTRKLKNNEFILLDFGVKYENYCSDMTRTIHFGKVSPEKKRIYETVLASQQKAIEQYNNETIKQSRVIKTLDLDNAARFYIVSKGYPAYPHGLGHGIGLEVHEAPRLSPKSKDKLQNGMVFSIEPGIYLPDKFGVRTEDLFTIQNNKLIQLTKSPKNLIEI